jgi:hypothetical protein
MKLEKPRGRRGFTIVEALVSVAIIGLLVGLILPAVQIARESARKTECRAHLRELCSAVANFESQHGVLPPERAKGGFRSPLIEILPMVDQAAYYNQVLREGVHISYLPEDPVSRRRPVLAIFRCPSDQQALGTNFRFNHGCDVLGSDEEGKGRGPLSIPAAPSSQVTDGLSNTVIMSEAVMSPNGPHSFHRGDAWYSGLGYQRVPRPSNDDVVSLCQEAAASPAPFYPYVGHDWAISGLGHAGYNHVLPPNATVLNCRLDGPQLNGAMDHYWPVGILKASSYHHGGVNVVMLDGSARFISNSIDLTVWQAISTGADGEPTAEF